MEIAECIDDVFAVFLKKGQQLDSAAVRCNGHTETACRGRCGGKGGERSGYVSTLTQHVVERVDNDVIQCHNDRQLHQKRQASAIRAEVLALIELLNFRLHFLHSGLVVASLVLVLDSHFLGTESCLLNGVLLLLNGERQHQNFDNDCEQADTDNVATKAEVSGNPVQNLTDNAEKSIPEAALFDGNVFAECINQCFNVFCVEFVKNAVFCFVRKLCVGKSSGASRRRGGIRFFDNILRVFEVEPLVFGIVALGIKALGSHIIAAVCRNQSLTRIELFLCAECRRKNLGNLSQFIGGKSVRFHFLGRVHLELFLVKGERGSRLFCTTDKSGQHQ